MCVPKHSSALVCRGALLRCSFNVYEFPQSGLATDDVPSEHSRNSSGRILLVSSIARLRCATAWQRQQCNKAIPPARWGHARAALVNAIDFITYLFIIIDSFHNEYSGVARCGKPMHGYRNATMHLEPALLSECQSKQSALATPSADRLELGEFSRPEAGELFASSHRTASTRATAARVSAATEARRLSRLWRCCRELESASARARERERERERERQRDGERRCSSRAVVVGFTGPPARHKSRNRRRFARGAPPIIQESRLDCLGRETHVQSRGPEDVTRRADDAAGRRRLRGECAS